MSLGFQRPNAVSSCLYRRDHGLRSTLYGQSSLFEGGPERAGATHEENNREADEQCMARQFERSKSGQGGEEKLKECQRNGQGEEFVMNSKNDEGQADAERISLTAPLESATICRMTSAIIVRLLYDGRSKKGKTL